MKLYRQLDQLPPGFRAGAVSIGNFDGVHLGHARLVERLRALAAEKSGPATVFTFDPHPVRLLRPHHAPPPLTWTERKAQLLAELGVDLVLAYPTDLELLGLSAEQFFQRIVQTALRAGYLIEGPNFFFGKDRSGNINVLASLCQASDIPLEVVPPVEIQGQMVSSSRIRQAITEGQVKLAARMMTRPYRVRGMVTHGARRGERLGFPTANLEAIDTLIPRHGVYAGRAARNGQTWAAAIHLGPRPTFSDAAAKVEVHLIGFDGLLYGEPLEVDFLERLRDIRSFPTPDALRRQLHEDVETCRAVVAAYREPHVGPADLPAQPPDPFPS